MDDVVIGLIGGRSGCALSSELHKRGIKVAAVIGKEEESGFDIADYVFVCDLSKHDKIDKFFKSLKVEKIIVGTGPFVAIDLCYMLEKKGYQINIDLDKFQLCKNKFTLNELMRKNSILTPEDILIKKGDDIDAIIKKSIKFPIVLKSIKDIFEPEKIESENELKKKVSYRFEKEDSLLLEQYLNGNDITVFVSNDKELLIKPVYWSKGKEDSLIGFSDSYSEKLNLNEELRLIEFSKKVIEIVKISGVFRIDLMYYKGEFYFFEINTILVSSLNCTTYSFKFYQEDINRAELIVNYALNKFNIKNQRKNKTLTILEDNLIVNSFDENELFVNKSKVSMLYKNGVYEYGMNYFYKYLDNKLGNLFYDKEFAKKALLCVLTSDADVVNIKSCIDDKVKLIILAVQFLKKIYIIDNKLVGMEYILGE